MKTTIPTPPPSATPPRSSRAEPVTIDTEAGKPPETVSDEAVRGALEQIDAVRRGDEAKKARLGADVSPESLLGAGYRPPDPPPPPATYRAPVPYAERPIGEMLGLGSPAVPAASHDPYGPPPLPAPPRDIQSLEDIFLRYPDIGQGQTILRVERVEPKMYGTAPTAGYLADLSEQLTTREFATRFGGGKYQLHVIGPPRDRHHRPVEGAPVRTLTGVPLRIPGPPNLSSSEYDPMNQRPGQYGPPVAYAAMNPEVEMRKLELDREREREWLAAQLQAQTGRTDPSILANFTDHQKQVVGIIERQAQDRILGYQAIIQDANARIKELETELRALLDQKVVLQRENAEARNRTETEQLRDQKDRYELQIRELKETRDRESRDLRERYEGEAKRHTDESIREKDRIVTDHRTAFESESRRHAEERQKLVDDVRNERDRSREQTDQQIALATKEHDRNIASIRENYEARILQMTESHRDRIDSLERTLRDQLQNEKSAHERELRSVETARAVMEKSTEQNAQARIQALEERLGRAEEDNDNLARENRELHQKLNKPPGEYIAETAEFAKTVLGMKTAEEAKNADEDFSISKVAVQSVKTLIEKAPEVARTIADMRQQGGAAQAQANANAVAQQQHQQAMAQHQHQLALAQHQEGQRRAEWEARQRQAQAQQQGRRPGENARPPQWAQQQPPAAQRAAPPAGANVGPKPRRAPPPTTGFPSVTPMPSPVSERVGVPPEAHPVDAPELVNMPPELRPPPPMPVAPAQAAPPPPHAAAQAAPPQGAQAAPTELTMQAIDEFLGDLATAIKLKVTPKFFATEFVQKAGLENVKVILARITADDMIAQLEAASEQDPRLAASPLMTLEGKRFMREVFKQTGQMVSQGGGYGAPPLPPVGGA